MGLAQLALLFVNDGRELLHLWPFASLAFVFACAAQTSSLRPRPPFAAVVGPVIIAHRGGSLEAPENTLAAIRHGVEVGADWQEIDVALTRDEHVVLMHDDTVERTTSGSGRVDALTLAQLRTLSAGRPSWSEHGREVLKNFGVTPVDFGDRFAGERVPTLEEALAIPQARLMIELKPTEQGEALIDKVLEAIARANASDRVALGSFSESLLDLAFRRDPTIPLIGIVEEEADIEAKLALPITVLAVRIDLVTTALDKAPAGVAVWGWTAYSTEMAEALVLQGGHGIITDVPAAVVKLLRAPKPILIPPSE